MTSHTLPISSAFERAQTLTAELLRLALAKMRVETFDDDRIDDVAHELLADLSESDIRRLAQHDQAAIQAMGERCVVAAMEAWITMVAQLAFYDAGRGSDLTTFKVMARDAFADINGKREGSSCFPPPEFIAQTVAAEYAARRLFA